MKSRPYILASLGWLTLLIALIRVLSDPANKGNFIAQLLFPFVKFAGVAYVLFAAFAAVLEYGLAMQVFRALNDASMSHYHDLKCLSYVLHGPQLKDDRPSWSPQWDYGTTRTMILTSWTFARQPYKANDKSPRSTRFPKREGASLRLQGLQIDTVRTPVSDMLIPADFEKTQQRISKTLNKILEGENLGLQVYHSRGSMSDAMMMTLTAMRDAQSNRRTIPTDTIHQSSTVSRHWIQDTRAWPAEFRYAATLAGCMHRYFRTERGYMGFGPQAMRPGDIVCIFFGATVPFIVRPQGGHYRLVGETYVHGLMDGEAVEQWKDKRLTKVEFELK